MAAGLKHPMVARVPSAPPPSLQPMAPPRGLPCREALRHMERGGCAPVQELDGLQRQLGELLQSPATRPPSSRGSTRQGARPSSRGRTAGVGTGGAAPQRGSRDAVAEQVAEASARGCSTLSSSAAVDSIGSPRIPAVHAVQPPAEAGGDRHDEAGSGSDSQQLSSRASVAHPADAQVWGARLASFIDVHDSLPPALPSHRPAPRRVLPHRCRRAARLMGLRSRGDRRSRPRRWRRPWHGRSCSRSCRPSWRARRSVRWCCGGWLMKRTAAAWCTSSKWSGRTP